MRGNRMLGSTLVEKNLVPVEKLEAANDKLLEHIQAGDYKRAAILNILVFEMNAVQEEAVIEAAVEEQGIGLIDLRNYPIKKFSQFNTDLNLSWVTWTLPFDRVEDFTMVATCYHLSKPVIKFWEEKLGGKILWYTTSIRSLMASLEKLEAEAAHAAQEAAKAEKEKEKQAQQAASK